MIFARAIAPKVFELETKLTQLLLGRTCQLFFSLRQFRPKICERCQQFFSRFLVSYLFSFSGLRFRGWLGSRSQQVELGEIARPILVARVV